PSVSCCRHRVADSLAEHLRHEAAVRSGTHPASRTCTGPAASERAATLLGAGRGCGDGADQREVGSVTWNETGPSCRNLTMTNTHRHAGGNMTDDRLPTAEDVEQW